MIRIDSDLPEFYNDISEEVRLFFGRETITEAQEEEPADGVRMLRIRHSFDQDGTVFSACAEWEGQSLSQWSLSNLDAAAARDIEEARAMRLPSEKFDRFCELLERPMPSAFRELLEWEPQWA